MVCKVLGLPFVTPQPGTDHNQCNVSDNVELCFPNNTCFAQDV
jgi:hypothetical protein